MSDKDLATRLAEIERLISGGELGRFHPELGDVYEQLDTQMRQTADSIMRTVLNQRKATLLREMEKLRGERSSHLIDVLERESWCTRWSCTTCGATPFRLAILEYASAQPVDNKVRSVEMAVAVRLLEELRELEPSNHYEPIVFLLRWIGNSIGEERTKAELGESPSGTLYSRMLEARDRSKARRADYARRYSAEFVAAERERKAAVRAERHSARLAAKRLRDAEGRKG